MSIAKQFSNLVQSLKKDSITNKNSASIPAVELLQRAARCYVIEGWADDACRLFDTLGDDRSAAPYHERLGRFYVAAQCYYRVSEWQNAARCFLKCDQKKEAALCLEKCGETIQAGWIWANDVHQYYHARNLIQNFAPQNITDEIAAELILTRCDAGLDSFDQAGKKLRKVIVRIFETENQAQFSTFKDWMLVIADTIGRPDLYGYVFKMFEVD